MVKKIFKIIILFLVVAFIAIAAGLMSLNYFLVPAIEKKVRQIVTENLGKRAELSQVNIRLPEAIILVKGFKIADFSLVKYNYSISVDEATLRVSLINTFLGKRLIFDKTYLKNAVIILEKKSLPPPAEASSSGVPAADTACPKPSATDFNKNQFSELYIRKLTAENVEFVFRDYSPDRPPVVIEIVDINGEIDNFLASFRAAGNFKGVVHFEGRFNSAKKGS